MTRKTRLTCLWAGLALALSFVGCAGDGNDTDDDTADVPAAVEGADVKPIHVRNDGPGLDGQDTPARVPLPAPPAR